MNSPTFSELRAELHERTGALFRELYHLQDVADAEARGGGSFSDWGAGEALRALSEVDELRAFLTRYAIALDARAERWRADNEG